jgi:hypothetical protein
LLAPLFPKRVAATPWLQFPSFCGFYLRRISPVLLVEGPHASSSWVLRFAFSLLQRHVAPRRQRPAVAHCLHFHILWIEAYFILGDQPSTIPNRGCKKHALAGEQLQSMLLTLLEKEVESCEQVISVFVESKQSVNHTLMLPLMSSILTMHGMQLLRSIPRSM